MRQQELLYNVEFSLQQMERKVARAHGHRTDDEARALNARIERLTLVLEGVNAEHSMLLDQVWRYVAMVQVEQCRPCSMHCM